jgi:molybdenum cofactor biosynthesis protein B
MERKSSPGKKVTDESGDIIERLAADAGHQIKGRTLIDDSKAMIRKTIKQAFEAKNIDAVVITGGTGLSSRDITIETIKPMLTKEISGFGELFRKISYERIGSPAMLSRALAGIVDGKAVFCIPGSPDAVQTAMEKLILPELGHVIRVARQH